MISEYEVTHSDLDRALAIAQRFSRNYPRLVDEFESAALVGLAEAACRYQAGRATFKTYSTQVVLGRIKDCARHWRPKGFRGTMLTPEICSLDIDLEESKDSVGWEIEHQDEVAGLARRLPENYRKVFTLFYTTTLGVRPLARALGISPSAVMFILEQSRKTLEIAFSSSKTPLQTFHSKHQ